MADTGVELQQSQQNPAPTPPQDDASTVAYASYVPHDLKYSREFEDALLEVVLNPPQSPKTAIRVIPSGSNEAAVEGVSIRASDVDVKSLPVIKEDELPLPLDDARRLFASSIPGVALTHPGGYLEGGPGLEPEIDTFSQDFMQNHAASITSPATLRQTIDQEIQASITQLKERLEARRRAKEKNEQIERDMKVLTDQHSMELRIQSRMAEERRRKKEAKEKKNEGG